jgi:ubiquinone/menaquinone biosynthesis C-methylase UbiE
VSDWDYGGQRRNMEDATMVAILTHQAAVVWPLEREILRRRAGRPGRVLDLACGTGEILQRLRAEFAPCVAVGLDLFRGHLALAAPPVVQGDGFRAPFPAATFDLVLVRHLLQALPDPPVLLREARRILKPGGRIHLLVEDYAGLFFDLDDYVAADHFREVAPRFRAQGSDLYQGRRALRHLREAGFLDPVVDPIVVDNQTSDRDAFAGVLTGWRDGYAATLAALLGRSEREIRRRFDLMVEAVRDPGRYAAWLLFAASASR